MRLGGPMMMQLLAHNEHEVAIKFKSVSCTASHLRQQAVEALHFLQRVYGITVVSAKAGCRTPGTAAALEALGITVVDGVGVQHVVNDSADVIRDVTWRWPCAHCRGASVCACLN